MSDTGVVDPIRIPPWLREPAERWWREMPQLARLFVGLVLLDVILRTFGWFEPGIAWRALTPLDAVSAFAPHDLWILLPALLVIRRPDVRTVTPWVFRGAVTLAIVEVARGPLQTILYQPSTATISALVAAVAGLAVAAAWALLGRGLAALTPRDPGQTVAGLSNMALAALGILAALYLAETIVSPGFDSGDPAYNQAITLSSLTGPIQVLGWGYLVWIVIRGLGDTRRPVLATNLAAAGALLAAFIVPVLSVLGRLLGAAGFNPSDGSGIGEIYLIISWFGVVAGPSLIAVSFALGLAEPEMPYVAARRADDASVAETEQPPDQPTGPAEAPSAP